MNLRKKWIKVIYTVATGSRKIRLILTPIIAVSYILFAVIFVIASLVTDKICVFPMFPEPPVDLYLPVPLILAGLFLIGWSQFNFFKVKGTPVPFNPPPELVASGPYSYMRNPMLSGIFMLLFGIGFALKSLSLIFIFTPLFIIVNVMEIKTIEEAELEMRLGEDYLKYKKKTPMFLPKIW